LPDRLKERVTETRAVVKEEEGDVETEIYEGSSHLDDNNSSVCYEVTGQ